MYTEGTRYERDIIIRVFKIGKRNGHSINRRKRRETPRGAAKGIHRQVNDTEKIYRQNRHCRRNELGLYERRGRIPGGSTSYRHDTRDLHLGGAYDVHFRVDNGGQYGIVDCFIMCRSRQEKE